MSVLVERIDGRLVLTTEEANGTVSSETTFEGTDDQLHTKLCNERYTKVGAAKGDKIAGVYVRLGSEEF